RRGDAQRRLAAHLHQRAKSLVAYGRSGGGGILRIERDEQDAVAAARGERLEPRRDRGLAVAHRPVDGDVAAERLEDRGELLGLRARDGLERRLVLLPVPDL